MPNNDKKAPVRTLLFVLATAMLLCPAGQAGGRLQKKGRGETFLPSFVKEAVSWMVSVR
ncbi:MAG: hypothetical protein IJZ33_01350 [Clostridia bacterium]|nr:hypothetical protein [Clostridia bacterium]